MALVYRNIVFCPKFDPKKGVVWVNIHYIVGKTDPTLADYQEIVADLKKELPFLDGMPAEKFHCSRITKSTFCDKFAVVMWDGYIPKDADFEGWQKWTNTASGYSIAQ